MVNFRDTKVIFSLKRAPALLKVRQKDYNVQKILTLYPKIEIIILLERVQLFLDL